MARSTFIKHYEDVSLKLADGTGTPIELTLLLDTGDISLSGLVDKLRETVAYERKGALQTVRKAARVYPTGSFTCQVSEFSETATGTVLDFLFRTTGTPFAAAVSTLGANAQVFTLDMTITQEGTDFGDAADGTLTLADVDFTVDYSAGEPNTITLNFTVYGAISGDLAIAEG